MKKKLQELVKKWCYVANDSSEYGHYDSSADWQIHQEVIGQCADELEKILKGAK